MPLYNGEKPGLFTMKKAVQILELTINGMRFLKPGVTSNPRTTQSPSPTRIDKWSPYFKIDRSWSASHQSLPGVLFRGSSGYHISQKQRLILFSKLSKTFSGAFGLVTMLRRLLCNYPDLVEIAGGRADIKGIHYAARWGHVVSVTLLCDLDASVDSKDRGSWTPLAYAIQGHHINVVTYLLSQQADPNVKASNGAAMLMFARRVEFDAGLAALNQYHATKDLVCDDISELYFSTLVYPR
jgi:hypothetical protein